jgi:hypothetical protein
MHERQGWTTLDAYDDSDSGSRRTIRLDPAPASVAASAAAQIIDLRRADPDHLEAALQPFRTARLLTSPSEITEARRLHASTYVDREFVSAADLAPDGTIGPDKDPWPAMSTYFGVLSGDVVMATARQIELPEPDRLPTMGLTRLSGDELRQVRDLPAQSVVEISALARRPEAPSAHVVAIYSRMWQESLARGHRVWLMAVDLPLFSQLRRFFCGDALRPIGPRQEYLGSVVVPAVVWSHELNPAQRRLAAAAGDRWPLRGLLPWLFPHPEAAALAMQGS